MNKTGSTGRNIISFNLSSTFFNREKMTVHDICCFTALSGYICQWIFTDAWFNFTMSHDELLYFSNFIIFIPHGLTSI